MDDTQFSISLSIVSHGQGDLITHLLDDLRQFPWVKQGGVEIFILLNIPEDEEFISKFDDLPLQIIRNATPKGFGANHNIAFRHSSKEVFVILNPDIRLSSLNLHAMRECLASQQSGAWAPLVTTSTGSIEDSARKFPTLFRLAERVLLRKRARDYEATTEPIVVDWVAGMFVAFPRLAFQLVDGFDERYFMYMEDADICRRMAQHGFRVFYDPRVSVIHDARRASRRDRQHIKWHLRSAIRFLVGV